MSDGAVPRTRVLVEALRHRDLRALAGLYTCFRVAEMGAWIAITTVAHEHGGITQASRVVVAQLFPAALAALCVGGLARRIGLRLVLAAGLVVQATCFAIVAALLWADAPMLAVYVVAVLTSVAIVTTRPTVAGVMPAVVDGPHELTAANSVVGLLDSAALMLGPVITAVGFATVGRPAPFAVFGVLACVAALLAVRLRPSDRPAGASGDERPSTEPVAPVPEPGTAPTDLRRTRPILLVLAGQALLVGALDLLFVVVAIDVTGGPPARAGWLNTAFGAGAVLGGAATAMLIGRRRLWPALLVAGAVSVVAVSLVGLGAHVAVSAVMFAWCGVGATVLFIATRTLLQRVCDLESLCRAFSRAEAAEMAMLLVGALVIPALVDALGASRAGVGIGALLALAVGLALPWLVRMERAVHAPFERLALLHEVELFATLPAPSLETLAREAEVVEVLPGTPVIVQGDVGERFYVIRSGEVAVVRDGDEVVRLETPGSFGELALLYDAPRNATVTATRRTELLAIDRVPFLVAMTGRPADQVSTVRAR